MLEKRNSFSQPLGFQELGVVKGHHGIPEINEDLEKEAVRMIDYTALPVISMFYLLSFLVRTSGTRFNSKAK
jgi:hypothetical protein